MTPQPDWRKAARSNGSSACVEVAFPPDGTVAVRDSKDPSGPVLTFTAAEWDAFAAGMAGGEFTRPGAARAAVAAGRGPQPGDFVEFTASWDGLNRITARVVEVFLRPSVVLSPPGRFLNGQWTGTWTPAPVEQHEHIYNDASPYVCGRCWTFDEEGALAEIERLRAERQAALDMCDRYVQYGPAPSGLFATEHEPPRGTIVASAGNSPWHRTHPTDRGWRLLRSGLGGQGDLIRCETWANVLDLAGGPLAILRWGWGTDDDDPFKAEIDRTDEQIRLATRPTVRVHVDDDLTAAVTQVLNDQAKRGRPHRV
ncbi:MAG TPA: DUF397 domain-containing protein [Jatrophihabitantaceae bacterium]|jgi:hypothetical protein